MKDNIPRATDPVRNLSGMSSATCKRLENLRDAAAKEAVGFSDELPDFAITTGRGPGCG